MTKKLLALALAALLALTLLASCGEKEPVAADVPLADLHNAIKNAYGEEYMANMPIDAEYLETLVGIKPEWCEEFVAEPPMIGFNPDILMIIKPTEGNEENVMNAFNAYYDYCTNNDYPANAEKVQATEIFSEGGYCFYFTLGWIPDDFIWELEESGKSEEEISAEKLAYAEKNNQKGIDAVNALFFPAESK